MSKRQSFLMTFMKMFECHHINILQEADGFLKARVFWDESNNDDYEEIRWDIADSDLPDEKCLIIVELLSNLNLIEIDMVTITRRKLFGRLEQHHPGTFVNYEEFEKYFEDLLSIDIDRVNENNEPFDSFYIHE